MPKGLGRALTYLNVLSEKCAQVELSGIKTNYEAIANV
jgi:hypothetical protein